MMLALAPGGRMDLFEAVTTQEAIGGLEPEPIPDAVLRQIMDGGSYAPNGGKRQGLSFLVSRGKAAAPDS